MPVDQRCIMPGSILADRYIAGMPEIIGSWLIRYIGWDALNEKRISIYEYMPERYASRSSYGAKVTTLKSKPFKRFLGLLKEKAGHLSEISVPDNIASVTDCFEANGTLYVMTDHFAGRTLEEFLGADRRMSQEEAENMLVPLMKSLDKLHDEHYVIGGFSPADLIVTAQNTLILDTHIRSVFFNLLNETAETEHLPEYDYFPYERLKGFVSGEMPPSFDVYSAAMILRRMTAGNAPDCRERFAEFQRSGKDILDGRGKKNAAADINKENALRNAIMIRQSESTPDMESFLKELTGGKEVARRDRQKKKKTPLAVKIAVPAFMLAAAGIILAVSLSGKGGAKKLADGQTLVPDLLNMNVTDASAELEKTGLLLEIEGRKVNDDAAEDIVTAQSIDADSVVKVNTMIGVVVNAHSGMVTMPDLRGMDFGQCRELLSALGIRYTVSRKYSGSIAENCVISQSISPYERVKTGEKTALVVSNGLDPDSGYDRLPSETEDLTGKTIDEIIREKDQGKGSSFSDDGNGNGGGTYSPDSTGGKVTDRPQQIKVTDRVYDDTKPEGTVVSQTPAAGTERSPSDAVAVTVTTRSKELIMPDVTLLSREEAENILSQYGLKALFSAHESNIVKEGDIISQEPSAGETVEIESEVRLTVSTGRGMVTMPSLTGKSREEAAGILRETGLAAKFTYVTDAGTSEDQVVQQEPEQGKELKAGSEVLVTLSTKKPVIEVPSVIGMNEEEASLTLSQAGLGATVFNACEDSGEELVVVYQSPEAGLYSPKGSDVFVVLGDSSFALQDHDSFMLSGEEITMTVGEEYTIYIYIPGKKIDITYTPDPGESSVIDYTVFDTSDPDHYEVTITAVAPGTETIMFSIGDFAKEFRVTVS